MLETILPQKFSFNEEELNMTYCFDILKYTLWKKVDYSLTLVSGHRIKFFVRNEL